jgi:molecular chaperone GrpE
MAESQEMNATENFVKQSEKPETIGNLEAQVLEYKDKYLRALAEIENTRKRLTKEKIESQTFAIQNVVSDMLQPIDHFEFALKHAEAAPGDAAKWALGFEMILQQLRQVLADHGVIAFESLNCPFDPHRHEAVETEEREDMPEGTIIQEFQKGYQLSGRIIRAARVKVSTKKTPEEQSPDETESNK